MHNGLGHLTLSNTQLEELDKNELFKLNKYKI